MITKGIRGEIMVEESEAQLLLKKTPQKQSEAL